MLVECRTGSAAALRPKLRLERQPFLAPEDVIFGVDFTGPHILVVISLFVLVDFRRSVTHGML